LVDFAATSFTFSRFGKLYQEKFGNPDLVQAIKDIDALLKARKNALKDPLAFVERLQRGEQLQLPVARRLPEMPNIDWDKYNLASLHQKKPETRNSKTGNGQILLISGADFTTRF
jgi:hypothetical protein